MPEEVYIIDGVRTPIGKFRGSLSQVSAVELGSHALKAILERTGLSPKRVDQVIIGQVYTAGCGQNPARQTSILSGLSDEVPAYTLNMLCGSGLKSVINGVMSIMLGDASTIIAGGQENMSRAPWYTNDKSNLELLKSTLTIDGLQDAFHNIAMGVTAENIAIKYNISRKDQEAYALVSQQKAERATLDNTFKNELVPVRIETLGFKGDDEKIIVELKEDEFIKKRCTIESISQFPPVFSKDGTVTAATSSGINDGSAMVLLMGKSAYEKASREPGWVSSVVPLARVISWAEAGVDPLIMGTGPIPATKLALQKAGWSIDDIDLFEFNEAFAVQSLAVIQELGVDISKCNVNGGAIALGHPLACSGTRILVTLAHALRSRHLKRGVASLCIGGGMGISICIEAC